MNNLYTKHKEIIILISCVSIIFIGFFLYETYGTKETPADMAKKEAIFVKKGLSRHLILPVSEDPDIRKINTEINSDPFFINAIAGDYLIIFLKGRIAYIYSPSRDIIVNAGVIFMNTTQSTSTKK